MKGDVPIESILVILNKELKKPNKADLKMLINFYQSWMQNWKKYHGILI